MKFHGMDLRKGRLSEIGRSYLLTTVTQHRMPLFLDFLASRLLVQEMKALDTTGLTQTWAYVVMPDHLHWLVELNQGDLKSTMQKLKSRSALQINRYLGSSGPVWQKGYYDQAVRKDEDLKTLARYVVANPLRAGLVMRIGDYPLWDAAWL